MADPASCPFCFRAPDRIAFEHRLVRALWDAFAVSPGHLLVVPRRHVATWFDANEEERAAVLKALDEAKALVDGRHCPDGYNIGINVGQAAGQTVFHIHVHLVTPRAQSGPPPEGKPAAMQTAERPYVPFSCPEQSPRPREAPPDPSTMPRLVSGGENDPLLPYLGDELAKATQADIAVGFVMPSGSTGSRVTSRSSCRRAAASACSPATTSASQTRRARSAPRPRGRDHPRLRNRKADQPAAPGTDCTRRLPPEGLHHHATRRLRNRLRRQLQPERLGAEPAGIEWNYRVVTSNDGSGFQDVVHAFEELWRHPQVRRS